MINLLFGIITVIMIGMLVPGCLFLNAALEGSSRRKATLAWIVWYTVVGILFLVSYALAEKLS